MYFSGASISLWDASHMRAVNRTVQSPAIPVSYANRELSKLLHYLQMAVQTLKIEMWWSQLPPEQPFIRWHFYRH